MLASALETKLIGACSTVVHAHNNSTEPTKVEYRKICFAIVLSPECKNCKCAGNSCSTIWLFRANTANIPLQSAFVRECRNNDARSEEHTSELQSRENLVCRLLLEKKKN